MIPSEPIVVGPEERLQESPASAELEREQLLSGRDNARSKCPQETCIHQLFEAQVISRIGSLFNADLPLRTIFEKSTTADLSQAVEDQLVAELQAMPEDEARHLL